MPTIALLTRAERLASSFINDGDVGSDGFRDGGSTGMEAASSSSAGASGDACNPFNAEAEPSRDPKEEQGHFPGSPRNFGGFSLDGRSSSLSVNMYYR